MRTISFSLLLNTFSNVKSILLRLNSLMSPVSGATDTQGIINILFYWNCFSLYFPRTTCVKSDSWVCFFDLRTFSRQISQKALKSLPNILNCIKKVLYGHLVNLNMKYIKYSRNPSFGPRISSLKILRDKKMFWYRRRLNETKVCHSSTEQFE